MFTLNLSDEDIVMKITTRKTVTNKDVAANFIGNMLTRAGGDIADKVNLILTKDSIYLKYRGHASIGYGEETRDIKKIPLEEVIKFSVTPKEKEELIKIVTNEKELDFIRDNSNNDNLALAMANVIKDLK